MELPGTGTSVVTHAMDEHEILARMVHPYFIPTKEASSKKSVNLRYKSGHLVTGQPSPYEVQSLTGRRIQSCALSTTLFIHTWSCVRLSAVRFVYLDRSVFCALLIAVCRTFDDANPGWLGGKRVLPRT